MQRLVVQRLSNSLNSVLDVIFFFILKENHPNCYKNGSSSEERKDEEGSNLTDESEKTKAEQGSNPMNESEKDDLDKVGNEKETKQQIIIQR